MPDKQSTHQIVDVRSITDAVVELTNGNMRSVLMVSSINFDLKSEEERKALIASFQQMLNSLDFTMQIMVQSRSLDLAEYFSFLREKQEEQESELMRIQTSEYIDFVHELIKLSNIMAKFFYVVVPYNVSVVEKSSLLQSMLPGKKNTEEKKRAGKQEAREELSLRVSRVQSLLGSMGLRAIPLQNRELAELFYSLYNPGVALKQKNLEQLIATGDEDQPKTGQAGFGKQPEN